MLPRALCLRSTRHEAGELRPLFLAERDLRWLQALLEQHARFVGQKQADLSRALREPLAIGAPSTKLRLARHVLEARSGTRTHSVLPPREARWLVFAAAAEAKTSRERVLSVVAAALGFDAADLEAALFADLRSERSVNALPDGFSAERFRLEINLELVVSLLRQATSVRIVAGGDARALARQARAWGLICLLDGGNARSLGENHDAAVALRISGPFSLFRHTDVYGRALARLLPSLVRCRRFELSIENAQHATLSVRSGDPLWTGDAPALPGVGPAERLLKAFGRVARDWRAQGDPEPLGLPGAVSIPDLELWHVARPERRYWLEWVGFWTRDYLAERLRRLDAAGLANVLLCVDERRCCGDEGLPADPRLLTYSGRLQPQALLAALQALEAGSQQALNGDIPRR